MKTGANKMACLFGNSAHWVLTSFLCVVAVFFAVKYTTLRMKVLYADGRVKVFNGIMETANETTVELELSKQLQYVIMYYPSDPDRVSYPQITRIVESARSNTISTIIDRFRAITGKDLGNNPQSWLKEYPTDW